MAMHSSGLSIHVGVKLLRFSHDIIAAGFLLAFFISEIKPLNALFGVSGQAS